MASRTIPIVVDPEYESNFKNRTTRDSELHEIPCDASNKTFQRRHSEDPNTRQSSIPTYYKLPGSIDVQGLTRRGSMPVYLDRPRASRDRFDAIVERMISADDDDLLSGIMDHDFRPFHDQDYNNKEMCHPRIHRRTSAPVSTTSCVTRTNHNTKNDIEIPVQICDGEHDKKRTEDSRVQNTEKPKTEEYIELVSEGTMTNNPEMKEESVQTDDGIVMQITEDHTKNTSQTLQKADPEITIKDIDNKVDAKKSANGDKEKMSCIKEIEESFKQTHEKVKALQATEYKGSEREYLQLEELLMKTLMSLDAVEANGSKCVREARRSAVIQVQEALNDLEMKKQK